MADGLAARPAAPGARPIDELPELRDARAPLRVLIASLAPGGAERIVIEWLAAEAARGREAELAVLHGRRTALAPPPGVAVRTRGREAPGEFLDALGRRWGDGLAPVSTHLVTDEHLAALWARGVRTVPVVHNTRAGWRNDPAAWDPGHVPHAVACAEAVRREMLEAGCRVPVLALRHRPAVGRAAVDPSRRLAIREELRIPDGTFLVGAIGAFKPQKDHARALEIVARVARAREAALVVLGGILEPGAFAELDRLLDAAVRLRMSERLRLPGFVDDVAPWLAACDALLNVSRHEGLSIGVQEALAAGLPVVAADVGGQNEIDHPALELVAPGSNDDAFAGRLARLPVRTSLVASPFARAPRAWSLTLAAREPAGKPLETLFVTANLNAGGAQRSLVNLATSLAGRHRCAIAVCGDTTHPAFPGMLSDAGVEFFRASGFRDDLAIAESLLAHASARGARNLCFWNVAPGVKLAVRRFAPPGLGVIDVSPGRYAFEELEAARQFGAALGASPEQYYRDLDTLVLKFPERDLPPSVGRAVVIPNGVAFHAGAPGAPRRPRFLVSGRVAPSKRLEVILAAFLEMRVEEVEAELHIFGTIEPAHREYAAALALHSTPGAVFRGACFDGACFAEPWTAAIVLGTHQGCPNAVLEAMAAGVPVIANDSGGTGGLLRDGRGWLVPERAPAAVLAATMREVVASPQRARARAATARAHAREFHSLEAMAGAYLRLLSPGCDVALHDPVAAQHRMPVS